MMKNLLLVVACLFALSKAFEAPDISVDTTDLDDQQKEMERIIALMREHSAKLDQQNAAENAASMETNDL